MGEKTWTRITSCVTLSAGLHVRQLIQMFGLSVWTTLFQLVWGASWAAVGFGAHFVASRYFAGSRKIGKLLLAVGLAVGAIAVVLSWPYQDLDRGPDQESGRVWLFLFGFALVAIPSWLERSTRKNEIESIERAELAEQRAIRIKEDELRLAQKNAFFADLQTEWPHRSECSFQNEVSQILLNSNRDAFRLISYLDDDAFLVITDLTVPLEKVFSVEVKTPEIVEKYYRTELVPIVTSKKKSVIGRAIVGEALLGPLGAVVGGMSGARADISTRVEERKVEDERIRKGSPILVIGTTDPDTPVLKVTFLSEQTTEQWEFRLRAAKASA